MNPLAVAIVLLAMAAAAMILVITVLRNLYVCSPSEVLIFSGRRWKTADGREVGFRVVRGGRALRIPLIEVVDRMQLTNMAIELTVKGAYSRGGVPLNVHAVANIKIPNEEPLLHNTLERFLSYSQQYIMSVAKDTLEGNLRGVIAELTPEDINQKKVVFQQKLIEEADRDLQRLGLVLDNLQIQNISDDVGYLTSVGRVRGATARQNARIGELRAKSDALVKKATNERAAAISRTETDIAIARKENQRRIAEAKGQREAVIAEVRGQVQAQVVEARAQLGAWDARIEQSRRRLEADVVAPANAEKLRAEAAAKAVASQIVAEGRAAAEALTALADAYKNAGPRARDALLLQKLRPVFEQLASTVGELRIDRLTVVGTNTGGGSVAGMLMGINEQLRAATGVDLLEGMRAKAARPPAISGADR